MSLLVKILRKLLYRNRKLGKIYFLLRGINSFSLGNLELKLRPYLDFYGGFYIECGANDGLSQSNTKYLEIFRNWRGLLIEPHPQTFLQLLDNRCSDNYFFNVALVPSTFKDNEVELTYSGLMTTPIGLETDLQSRVDHLNLVKNDFGERQKNFFAPARTLDSILYEIGAPTTIDFFSLDVEGSELAVLQGLDLVKYDILLLLVECRNFKRLSTYLDSFGYSFVEQMSPHDYLFRKNKK